MDFHHFIFVSCSCFFHYLYYSIRLIKQDYTQFFEQLKEQERERFKEIKKKKTIEVNQILNT